MWDRGASYGSSFSGVGSIGGEPVTGFAFAIIASITELKTKYGIVALYEILIGRQLVGIPAYSNKIERMYFQGLWQSSVAPLRLQCFFSGIDQKNFSIPSVLGSI